VTGGRATEGERRRPLVPILLFVLGFTLVFTLLGAFAGALVGFVRDPWFQGVAGLVVTLLGVLMIGFALWRGSPAHRRGATRLLERMRAFSWIRRRYRTIAAVSGVLLVAAGVLLMTGLFRQITASLSRFAPRL